MPYVMLILAFLNLEAWRLMTMCTLSTTTNQGAKQGANMAEQIDVLHYLGVLISYGIISVGCVNVHVGCPVTTRLR